MSQRIVIVGAGFAGAYCAQQLERRLRRGEAEVLVVDRNNYFVFYPLLVEAGTGSLEPRHAVVSVRDFLRRADFRMGEVTDVDLARRELRLRLAEDGGSAVVPYDHLVLCPGSVTKLPPVEGLAEHGLELKSMADAVGLRDRAIRLLELADSAPDLELRRELLHFVVVGGNFTGVELVGELHVFLHRARRRYRNVRPDDVRVTLVEMVDRILPALDEEMSRYAAVTLERRGVRVELGRTVSRIGPRAATLDDGRRLATRSVIWCAGIAPSPLIGRLELPRDDGGWLLCEPDGRVKGREREWSIGDCAVNPGPDGKPYPATAQHAVRLGEAVARNLIRVLRGEATRPAEVRSLGSIAALGCRTGVAQVFGMRVSGFLAWFLFRTVYLFKMPGWRRRARVALDWTIDLLFGRDVVQLGLARPRTRNAETPRE